MTASTDENDMAAEISTLQASLSRLSLPFNPTVHLVILPPLENFMEAKLEKVEHYDPLSADQMKPAKDFTATEFFAPEPLPSAISLGSLPTSAASLPSSGGREIPSEPLKPASELLAGFDPNKYLATPNTSRSTDMVEETNEDSTREEADDTSEDSPPMRIDDGEIRDSRDVMQMLRELSVLRGN